MEQDTLRAIAEIRHEMGQLRSALGAGNADQAEQVIGKLVSVVRNIEDANQAQTAAIQALVQQNQNQAQDLLTIKAALQSIIAWGRTVTPPYGG